MSLVKHEPGVMDPFHTLMDRWLEDFPLMRERPAWLRRPSVDVMEDEKAFRIQADLPDIDPNELEVKLEGDTLTLAGERKLDDEQTEENYRRVERFRGTFERTFTLPEAIDPEGVKAAYDKGVLTITIPKTKTEPRKVRTVKVQ